MDLFILSNVDSFVYSGFHSDATRWGRKAVACHERISANTGRTQVPADVNQTILD